MDAVLATVLPKAAPGADRMTGRRDLPIGPAVLAALAAAVLILAVRAASAIREAIPAPPAFAAPAPADPAILGRFDPFFRAAPVAGDSLPVSSLPLALKGIRLDIASGRGSAIVAGADGVQTLLAPGEEVMPGVRLRALAIDHIVLDNSGTLEALWLDEASDNAVALAPRDPPVGTPTVAMGGAVATGGDASGDEALPDPAPEAPGDE